MSPDGPRDQCGTAHRRADEVAMDTFTVRLPRWPVLLRLLGRDSLVRTIDRIEALVLALAVAVSLLAAPIAAAVGTAVYDSSRHLYAEQADTRHTVVATVTDVPDSPILRTRHHHRAGPMGCRRHRTHRRSQGAIDNENLVTPLRYGSTTAEHWSPHQPRPSAPPWRP